MATIHTPGPAVAPRRNPIVPASSVETTSMTIDWMNTACLDRRRPIEAASTPAAKIVAASAIQTIRRSSPVLQARKSPKPNGAAPSRTAASRLKLCRGDRFIEGLPYQRETGASEALMRPSYFHPDAG